MNRLLLLLAFSCLAASALAASQKVYEWTDAGGIKHYSDAPPPHGTKNVKVVKVHTSTPPTEQPPPAANGNGGDNPGKGPAPSQQSPRMSSEERASACQTARNNLKLLRSNPPQGLHTTAKNGKAQQISASEIQAQIAKAAQQIRYFCK